MIHDELVHLLQPSIEALGCELWGLEYLPQGKYALLRIYIDKPEGIHIDDCEQVSRQVSAILDVNDPISGQYTLEVSSPGTPRPLFFKAQYERFIGEPISIRLQQPVAGRRNIQGLLRAITDDHLHIGVDEDIIEVLFSNIIKAHLTD